MAELTASEERGGEARTLSRSEALWLFDRRAGEAGAPLRAFVHESIGGPAVALLSERDLIAFVRKEIAAGALIAVLAGQAAKPLGRRPRSAESAPVPMRRAPPPAPPADAAPYQEDIEFKCPEAQALALVAAAENGVPFCAECARAAALRAAGAGA